MIASQRARTAAHLTVLFLVAWGVRLLFFQGCILGDDGNDIAAVHAALGHSLSFTRHWELRIFLWFFIALAQKVFGLSEWSLFLATWIFSSSLSLLAYLTMTRFGYRGSQAFLAGLFVATAPYEVLIGSLHSSDLFLEWFFAVGFLVLFTPMRSQILHGIVLAVILWGAFYNKFWWSFFLLPVLAVYFWRRVRIANDLTSMLAFGLSTLLLHTATCIFWKIKTGTYFPFVETVKIGLVPFIIRPAELWATFAVYPKLIFQGSEFHTTLFGAVPYLFIGFLVIKGGLALGARRTVRFDALDLWLLLLNGSLFLLINFLSANFKFDHYYSVPRIFRYLAPISFPLALHTGKLAVDLASAWNQRFSNRSGFVKSFPVMVFWVLLLSTNLGQAAEATRPGRVYRAAFLNGVREVRRMKPPRVVVECWMTGFWTVLSATSGPRIRLTSLCTGVQDARDWEAWIRGNEAKWEPGTVLFTGVAGYVHYGCHNCGPRLRLFSQPLSPRWTFYRDLGLQDYLPTPERAALWVLQPVGPEVQRPNSDRMGGVGRVGKFLQEFTGDLLLLDRAAPGVGASGVSPPPHAMANAAASPVGRPASSGIPVACIAKWTSGASGTFTCEAPGPQKNRAKIAPDTLRLDQVCVNDLRLSSMTIAGGKTVPLALQASGANRCGSLGGATQLPETCTCVPLEGGDCTPPAGGFVCLVAGRVP